MVADRVWAMKTVGERRALFDPADESSLSVRSASSCEKLYTL